MTRIRPKADRRQLRSLSPPTPKSKPNLDSSAISFTVTSWPHQLLYIEWKGNLQTRTGIKLPAFHRKYSGSVNAWITVIEDRFYLHATLDNKMILDVSALFMDEALVSYLDLCSKYPHGPPSWDEFKMELNVNFLESPIRMSYLRT